MTKEVVVPIRPLGEEEVGAPDLHEHIEHALQAAICNENDESQKGMQHWMRLSRFTRAYSRSVDPYWFEIMRSKGDKSYVHHWLPSGQLYGLRFVPGDRRCFPGVDRLTNEVIHAYGTQKCGYGDPRGGLIPELFINLSMEKQQELRSRGFRYIAAIHDQITELGLHRRLWFQLVADFDVYFDPQDGESWKPGGLFVFPVKRE